jgi:DNA-binding transcriptional LysR family regulator
MSFMNPMHLASADLNLLVALDALLQAGSVTRAASRIGLTQSAMSHALSRLRRQFDDPLFVRGRRGLQPTARAEELRAPIAAVLADIAATLVPRTPFDPARATARFTIMTNDYAELVLLPSLVERLTREAPGIDLAVEGWQPDAERRLESGEVDLAIGLPSEGVPGIRRQKLFTERFVCMVRTRHPSVRGRLTLPIFARLPHLLVAPHGRSRGVVDEVLARAGFERRIGLRISHFLVAPRVIARSNLVLTLPERAAKAAATPRVRLLPPPIEVPSFTMVQLWHERTQTDPGRAWLRSVVAAVGRTV